MKTYQELLESYRKRQRSTVVDAIATGLTYVDEIAVDSGLLEETGLGSGQVPVLMELTRGGQLSQKELAERVHVTPATMSGLLKRMERSGFIRRTTDENDARVSLVELTEEEARYIDRHVGVYPDYPLAAGECHLNGAQALSFARCRKLDNDLGRGARHYLDDCDFYRPTAVSVVPMLLGFLLADSGARQKHARP